MGPVVCMKLMIEGEHSFIAKVFVHMLCYFHLHNAPYIPDELMALLDKGNNLSSAS